MTRRTAEIITLFREGVPQAEIARRVGCSKPNVSQTISRHLGWNSMVTPLPEPYHVYVISQADKKSLPPQDMAAELLMFAIDQLTRKP